MAFALVGRAAARQLIAERVVIAGSSLLFSASVNLLPDAVSSSQRRMCLSQFNSARALSAASSSGSEKISISKPLSEVVPEAGPAPTSGSAAVTEHANDDTVGTGAASSTNREVEAQEEWTEVVHQETGQTYYWNQKTGQTTNLGEPRPKFGGNAGSDGSSSKGGAAADSEDAGATYNARDESPLPDRTGTYGAIGIVLGAFLGWASQFF